MKRAHLSVRVHASCIQGSAGGGAHEAMCRGGPHTPAPACKDRGPTCRAPVRFGSARWTAWDPPAPPAHGPHTPRRATRQPKLSAPLPAFLLLRTGPSPFDEFHSIYTESLPIPCPSLSRLSNSLQTLEHGCLVCL